MQKLFAIFHSFFQATRTILYEANPENFPKRPKKI